MTTGLLQRTFPTEVAAAIDNYPPGRQASAVLPLLYLAQAAYGRVTADAVVEVATLLEIDETRVRGIVGFYSLFKEEPHGRFVVHYCTDLPCMLRGAGELLPDVCRAFGAEPGQTSEDGLFSLEEAMCLAACDRAPMMQVNLEYFHDLSPERLDEIVADLRAKAAAGPAAPFGLGPPSEIVRPD
jgi:NADH-quinone oxidoreductase subunit E